MAKTEIRKLIDDANKLLETEYNNHVSTIKNELRSFKSKTLEKIQKNTP